MSTIFDLIIFFIGKISVRLQSSTMKLSLQKGKKERQSSQKDLHAIIFIKLEDW